MLMLLCLSIFTVLSNSAISRRSPHCCYFSFLFCYFQRHIPLTLILHSLGNKRCGMVRQREIIALRIRTQHIFWMNADNVLDLIEISSDSERQEVVAFAA